MPKNKQKKFAEINAFSNVVQPGYKYPVTNHPIRGSWNEEYFFNQNPITLEVGCGKGEYTIGLAGAFPDQNFVGIDIKGNRLWTGAKFALENAMFNVAFLRIQAEHLKYFYGPEEVSGIWITFPDPQPNKPREKKRLISERFLDIYAAFLKPGAPLMLKTDNKRLFDYTLETIERNNLKLHYATDDLYANPGNIDPVVLDIKTYYEKTFLEKGEKICFIQFSL